MDAEFSEFFRAHAAYVAESLRRLGVAPADAEDMTHEVFLAVHRRFSDYDRVRSGKPWLFAFAIRIASNYRQRSSFRSEVLGSSGDDPEIADSRPDVLAKLEQDAARKQVHDALLALPLERRTVFIMYELDQRNMTGIAKELSIPLATAYSRLRIGRDEFAAAVRRLEVESTRPRFTPPSRRPSPLGKPS